MMREEKDSRLMRKLERFKKSKEAKPKPRGSALEELDARKETSEARRAGGKGQVLEELQNGSEVVEKKDVAQGLESELPGSHHDCQRGNKEKNRAKSK